VTLQSIACIFIFGNEAFNAIKAGLGHIDVVGFGLQKHATSLRRKVMSSFEAQARVSCADLLSGTNWLDTPRLAAKYCDVAKVCGAKSGGHFADKAAYETALSTARRVLQHWDGNEDGKLDAAELEQAVSATDGKISLASIDPGSGDILTLGNLWNGFIAALVLFFAFTIVDQLAKSKQAELDDEEISKLEKSLRNKKVE